MSRYGPEENAAHALHLSEALLAWVPVGVEVEWSVRNGDDQVWIRRDGAVSMIVTVRRHNIGITSLDRAQPPYSLPRNATLDAVCLMVVAALEYRGAVSS